VIKKTCTLTKEHYIDYAIFSAIPSELKFLRQHFLPYQYTNLKIENFNIKVFQYKNKKILFASTGIGTTFASSIVTLIHNYFHPTYMFFIGTAGGIKQGLKLKDVVIASRAFEAEIQEAFSLLKGTPFEEGLKHPLKKQMSFPIYDADQDLLNVARMINFSHRHIYFGTVVTTNTFPSPKESFEKIKNKNPLSIDMETSAFYQIAWLLKIKALAIRGISNLLDRDGTDEKTNESDVYGSTQSAGEVLLQILELLISGHNR